MFLSLGQLASASHQQVLSVRASSRPPSVGAAGRVLGGGGFTISTGFVPSVPSAVLGVSPAILFGSISPPSLLGGGGLAVCPGAGWLLLVEFVPSPAVPGLTTQEVATVTKNGSARLRRFLGDMRGE